MSSLVGPIKYNKSPASYIFSISGPIIVKGLAWYRHIPNTRKSYNLAIESYKLFYILWQKPTLFVIAKMLENGVVYCNFDNIFPKQG